MSCPDCGKNLDDVPVGDPCPKCGGERRDATVQAGVALAAVAVLTASVDIGYGSHRPWQQKWQDVVHGLDQIETAYDGPDRSNEPLRRMVEGFFRDCRELADWIEQDAGRRALVFVNTDPDLRLCDGLAQTVKHHTRTRQQSKKDPDPITARITWVRSGGGVRVEIGWSSFIGSGGTEDARDLARRCVASWERFFRQEGLAA